MWYSVNKFWLGFYMFRCNPMYTKPWSNQSFLPIYRTEAFISLLLTPCNLAILKSICDCTSSYNTYYCPLSCYMVREGVSFLPESICLMQHMVDMPFQLMVTPILTLCHVTSDITVFNPFLCLLTFCAKDCFIILQMLLNTHPLTHILQFANVNCLLMQRLYVTCYSSTCVYIHMYLLIGWYQTSSNL